ncbi:MAG: hypothetical protein ISS35_08580 [Kiritimatiellae bacterium]|nr:hypothetical protein [Kiritimatiellia bacterium]
MSIEGRLTGKRRFPMWSLLLILFSRMVLGQSDPSLDLTDLRSRYDKSLHKIKAAYSNDLAEVSQDYSVGLDQTLEHLKQSGLIESYLAVQEEKKRFKANGSILLKSDSVSKYIKKLQDRFHESRDDAELLRRERMAKLLQNYVKALNDFIKIAMRQDEMEKALAAKKEKDRISFEMSDIVDASGSGDRIRIPPSAKGWGGHHYLLVEKRVPWHEAQRICQKYGGYLACVTTAAENAFLTKMADNRSVWLGGTDEKQEGKWVWVSGEPFKYSNWFRGQPANDSGTAHYLHLGVPWMNDADAWDDFPVDAKGLQMDGFICEWDR